MCIYDQNPDDKYTIPNVKNGLSEGLLLKNPGLRA